MIARTRRVASLPEARSIGFQDTERWVNSRIKQERLAATVGSYSRSIRFEFDVESIYSKAFAQF